MPFYQQRGQVPHKRHTQFAKSDGTLHHEQLFGTIGFDGHELAARITSSPPRWSPPWTRPAMRAPIEG